MFNISCIQLRSNNNIYHNFNKTKKLIIKAVKQKADLIITPETSSLFSLNRKELLKNCTSMSKDFYLNGIKQIAKKYKKWILIGSIVIKLKKNKLVNRSILIDNNGQIKTYYDKIHMYDVNLSRNEKYAESKIFSAGKKIKSYKLPWGKIGMTICYDLRFPQLYKKLAKKGADFFSIPAAFTYTTGKEHWHSLLRARAIENGCFVFAPAQCGKHDNGRQTFGHSMIIDPWGKIIEEAKNSVGIISANIDLELIRECRNKIPAMTDYKL